ncbi:MAG: hypothetical protein ACREXY_00030 [Gammaproteobacteria bacterium]
MGIPKAAARWLSDDSVWLDHAVLTASDAEWLGAARRLTLWAVKVPPSFFQTLPSLEWLDVRGGSGESAEFVDGCVQLRYLAINQIRGLHDLTPIGDLTNLEFLNLYGLPKVRSLPSLTHLKRLRRIEIGSMKGIEGLGPLLDAPGLEELVLARAVSLAPSDPARISEHPTLSAFEWFAEDVPDKVWLPVVKRVGKPKARAMHPEDWFARRT